MRYVKFARRFSPVAAIGLSAAFLSPSAGAQTYYSITDLGTLFGYPTQGNGINNSGVTVGYSNSGSSVTHAFYNDGSGPTGIHDIGTPTAGSNKFTSFAYGINDSGLAVGSDTGATGKAQAFSYDTAAQTKNYLGFLSNGNTSTARAVSSSGQIVGSGNTVSGGATVTHAFSYSVTSGLSDIGTIAGTGSQALGVNAAGTIVGASTFSTSATQHAFSYSAGAFTDLGTPSYLSGNGAQINVASQANAINASGTVIGYSPYKLTNPNGTFSYVGQHAVVFTGGGMFQDLGTTAGFGASGAGTSSALGINSLGQIVGNQGVFNSATSLTVYSALLFHTDGSLPTDLNTLVTNGANWHLQYATGINDNGQIVGYGTFGTGNSIHAFVLNQTPAPSSLLVVALGAIPAIGILRRRRK